MELIRIYKNNLSREFCDEIIDMFEEGETLGETHLGITFRGLDPTIKESTDLAISGDGQIRWKEIDTKLYEALQEPVSQYLSEVVGEWGCFYGEDTYDTGYQIQRTKPGTIGYIAHNDSSIEGEYRRIVTYIWYLNDVEEDGETEFIDRMKVKPEAGKLVLFPATWTFPHRGIPPKTGLKYICTGWVYSK